MERGTGAFGGRQLAIASLILCVLLQSHARADVLLDETHAVSIDPQPIEQTLTVNTAGSLDVTVVDQGFPAPLSSIWVAVTSGTTVVQSAMAAGTLTFAAQPGTYSIRVIGRPGPAATAGTVSVTVTPHGAAQPVLLSFTSALQRLGNNPLQVQVDQPLTIPDAGDYTVTLVDQQFPSALATLTAAVFLGSQLIATITPGSPVLLPNLVASSPGAAAQYKITVIAGAAGGAVGGLWGLRVVGGPNSAVVADLSSPLGALAPVRSLVVPAAGTITLRATDFAFPSALTAVGAALTSGEQLVAEQLGTGATSVAVPSGALQLWRVATAGPAAGSYLIAVDEGGSNLYADAEGVSVASPGAASAYAFPFVVPAAGAYTARVTDFQFPTALVGLQFAVVQNAQLLQQAGGGGSVTFTAPSPGPATLLAIAQPSSGTALFGAEVLTTDAAPTHVLDVTQGIGGLFSSYQVTALTSAPFDVTLTDGAWPAPFQELALALTRGGQLIGQIRGGGSFPANLTPGVYTATFIAVPSSTVSAGLYSITVQSSVPTLSLSVDQSSIQGGQGVRLTWSSAGASACTASGGWSGSEPTSGNAVAVGPLAATTTFTLTCSGPGGTSVPKSVTVTVTPINSTSGGGGGAFDFRSIAALALLTLFAAWRRVRRDAASRPR